MMIWDIPVGVISDGMGDPIMHVHHLGTFIVSAIALGLFSDGTPIGSAYVPFFLGIVELSSIPLAIVDGKNHFCLHENSVTNSHSFFKSLPSQAEGLECIPRHLEDPPSDQ